MIDLKKELDLLNSKTVSAEDMVREFDRQKKELAHKSYIIRIVSMANNVEEAIKSGLFFKNNIGYITLRHTYIENLEAQAFDETLYNFNKEVIRECNPEVLTKIRAIFHPGKKLFTFDPFLINANFKENSFEEVELKAGAGERILELFLRKDLKMALDYNRITNALPETNNKEKKKPKL